MININDSHINPELTFKRLVYLHMQQLTNFPYIEKDFDALTDYELLCLVVKFLNDVIKNSNDQNDSITNLYNAFLALQDYMNNSVQELEDAWNDKTNEIEIAFNQLHDYVQNYFANLDVQEEINNKLDQMLEDGVLEQIIEQFIQSTALWCFDTVADMKLATNFINGSYAKTMGYHSLNDGGKSTYKIRTKTNEDVIDEASIIALNDVSLIAELIIENNILYPEQFGAYGDNTHDDYIPIQNCINFANTKKCEIEMNKEYVISNTLNLYSDLIININKLSYTGNETAILMDSISYVTLNIKELNSEMNGITLLANDDINHNNTINVTAIYGENNGIQMIAKKGIAYNKFVFSLIACDNYGIYVYSDRNTYSSAYIGENSIYGGRISRGVWGIYADGVGSMLAIPTIKIYNVALETPTNGIYFNNVEYGLIDYPRFGEMGSTATVISFNGDCRNSVFNAVAPLYTANIQNNVTNPTHKRNPILINCPILKANGNSIGKYAQVYSSGLSIIPITKYRTKVIGNETYTVPVDEFQFEAFTVSNNATLNLNHSYGSHNIDNFIVTITPDKTLVVYDSSNTKIFDNTNSTSSSYSKYKFFCIDENGTDKWKYIEYNYTSI